MFSLNLMAQQEKNVALSNEYIKRDVWLYKKR